MKKFYQKIKTRLAWKMLFIYIFVILIPTIIFCFYYFVAVRNYLENEEYSLEQKTLEQYCSDIDDNFSNVEKVYSQVQQHSNFIRFLSGEYSSIGLQLSSYISEFSTMFSYTFLSSPYIESVKVYMVDPDLLNMGDHLESIDNVKVSLEDPGLPKGMWGYDAQSESLIYRRAIWNNAYNSIAGVLEVSCKETLMLESMRNLSDQGRRIIMQYQGNWLDVLGDPCEIQNQNTMVVLGNLNHIPIQFRIEIEKTGIINQLLISLLVIFLCMIGLSLLYYSIVRRLSNRITRFSQTLENQWSDAPRQYTDPENDEFSRLVCAYNDMVENNDYLLNQVKIEQLHQQETAYKMLQSQIDPHFMYNALEGIRMMAEMRDQDDISDMIFSLGKMMRYSFSVSSDQVPIEMELDFVRQYLNIQKMRLGSRLTWEVCCDEQESVEKCPRFSIQPLVENAIKYGFGPEIQHLHISVRIQRKDGLLQVLVENTGKNMEPEVLEQINSQLALGGSLKRFSSGNGVGMGNINSRMRYLYGSSFSLVMSNLSHGIRVCMEWNPNFDIKQNIETDL